jgi:NDP-4-keto-2,6-dideoxyhexose 3-C-methyltransferase
VSEVLAREQAEGYDTLAPFERFRRQIEQARARCEAFFVEAAKNGSIVHGYAASTKGNTLLQYFGVGPDKIAAISDVNADKWGRFTPGTAIPIISEATSRAARPDYYFVLAWHFRDAFIQRERAFLEAGGKLVFPLPRFEVVDARALH